MAVWVSKVRIKGVRGFNEETTVELGPTLTLLIGRNGAGKTSFLQAIEWCLTGKMKYMEGDEFSREDAIVNLFNPSGVGKVTLTLQAPKGELEVSRTRKRGKSTTRGSSPLTVKIGTKVLEDEEAEAHLEKTLGLPIDEISNSIYLHQAALRAILSDDPKERSRSIDKMLGMEEIRSFAEALSTKRNITKATKDLQTRIETLKRDKVQYAVMTRENLEKARKVLIDKGYHDEDLDVVRQVALASAMVTKSASLKTKFGFTGVIPKSPGADVVSISRFLEDMDETLRSIDRRRAEALQSLYRNKVKLEGLRDRLAQDSEEVRALAESSASKVEFAEKLTAEERSLGDAIAEKSKSFSELTSVVSGLTRVRDRVGSIRSSKSRLEANISKIEQSIGRVETHEEMAAKQRVDLARLEGKLESLGSLETLLGSALDYLSESKVTKCPVCEQPISSDNVIVAIRRSMNTHIREEIESLKSDKKSALSQIHALETSLKELKELQNQLEEQTSLEREALQSAEKEMGFKLGDDLDLTVQSKKEGLHIVETEVRQIRERLNETSVQLRELKSELDRFNNARSRLHATVALAQKELNSKSDENMLAEEIKTKIAGAEEEENQLRTTAELDVLKKSLDDLENLNEFSKSEVELERIEKEVPNATALIKNLEVRLISLKDFEASLASIKEVLGEYEQRKASGVVESLETSFNQYFKSLDPHEHFKRIQVEVEVGQPPLYSIRAIGKEQSTYITTRFSNAQMNAAALALFLAKNEKVAGDIGTILLDDPTQSMDEVHKNAVCKSVTGLLKDKQVVLATQDPEITSLTKDAEKRVKVFEFSDWTVKGPTIG